ncbi:MAG: RnfABCDGE type electron transport complex subunit A [Clostridiaceae bacterium]|jgi:electron transport complex protein RnfA|nr:RnfABCDGE type electron transport complex subunit A [Clostridia bacterium]MBP6162043.1 RnfABCDGE type electron transport complex subunit A [Clostridia bacterium]MBP6949926.1 RnfABCDGE type electron transport complex subunit A [Clostridia bacterium]NMA35588.1 RnfABCDGE type electron transport complex subunit A [Clostridiaceae bacterium]
MKEMLIILLSVVLIDNLVLSRFLGVCSFLGLTKDLKNAMGMSVAVIFVMIVATGITYPIYWSILEPINLGYLQTVVFILVIAAVVQVLEAIIRKAFPPLYKAMGIYLPLITTNCAILGVMLINIQEIYNFGSAMMSSFGAGVGYMLAMFLFTGVREKMEKADIPEFMQGLPITLMAASVVSVSFMGFKGVIENLFG